MHGYCVEAKSGMERKEGKGPFCFAFFGQFSESYVSRERKWWNKGEF